MGQISMNAYDADVYIPQFKGLMQYGDQMGGDLRFSPDCMNIETPAGVLQPSMKWDGVSVKFRTDIAGRTPEYANPGKVGTLMYLRDRPNSNTFTENFSAYVGQDNYYTFPAGARSLPKSGYDVYLIAAANKLFQLPILNDPKETGEYVARIVPKNGTILIPSYTFNSDRWSWCTYEYTDPAETNTQLSEGQIVPEDTYDILLMSNYKDGMYMYKNGLLYDVTTPEKFTWIEEYADRIWGCGSDSLYYSKPYDATDWNQDNDHPEDGGGQIYIPTWDKDRFVALKKLGDSLIAFTEKRAYRISGTDPSNFVIQEQFGNGCKYPDTLVNMGQYLLMLGEHSIVSYDGYKVTPFMEDATTELFKKINWDDFNLPCATRVGDKYVLTMSNEVADLPKGTYAENFARAAGWIPEPGTGVEINPARGYFNLVFDQHDGTIVCNETPQVLSLCELAPFALTYEPPIDGDDPVQAKNKFVPLRFDSWENQSVTDKATRWVSPWVTFGRQDIKKGGFDMYFTPEVRPKKVFDKQLWSQKGISGMETASIIQGTEEAGDVTFKFSIQTEKKTKTKEYTVHPLTDEEIAAGKKHKMKKLHFGGSGRRFRLIIETEAGNTIPWRLIGGIHIIAETDKD